MKECLARLDTIVKNVKFETDRHAYKFRGHPGEFNNSLGYYRMMMMATVLQQDLGIHYNPERANPPWEPAESDAQFFGNSRDVFIHGLTREKGAGTCSSLPVFYVAIGRRLGYPLKLVKAKGHLYVRWDEGDESFNIEGTTIGFVSHPDSYYRTWPAATTPEEELAEGYFKPLTPLQELAVFLSIRGHCLRAAGDHRKSLGAFAQAFYKEPKSIGYQRLFARAEREAAQVGTLPKRQALLVEAGQLVIPDGPMRAHFYQSKARLQAMLAGGAPEGEIEVELQALKAELSRYQPPTSPVR